MTIWLEHFLIRASYWASSYKPKEYSFAQYALENGYSVFWYDRVGTGRSQM